MTVTGTGARTPRALPEGTGLAAELCGPDPYPACHRLRRDYPVLEASGAAQVFGYDDVAAVLRHPAVSADDRTPAPHRLLRADVSLLPPRGPARTTDHIPARGRRVHRGHA